MRYYFLLIIIFTFQGCDIGNNTPTNYIEGDGYVDTMISGPVFSWLSPSQVIYGVNATGKKNSYSKVDKSNLETSKQINILDLTSKETLLYRKGQLIKYENDNIHIRLSMGKYDQKNNEIAAPISLYGKLGTETQDEYEKLEERYRFSKPGVLKKCPSDDTDGETYVALRLKSEHGCLRLPSLYGKDRRWIYFQSNGEATELTESEENFLPKIEWVSWLNAYILDGLWFGLPVNTTKLKVLFVDGKFDLIDIPIPLYHAKPTKVGIIGSGNHEGGNDGLRLLHEGAVYRLTTGKVKDTKISPDGCKVAYITDNKLRVLNACTLIEELSKKA